jgi:hypothetical protein
MHAIGKGEHDRDSVAKEAHTIFGIFTKAGENGPWQDHLMVFSSEYGGGCGKIV